MRSRPCCDDLQVGLVDPGQLDDDRDAVVDAVYVDARPPRLLQPVARRGSQAEHAVEEIVDPLAQPLEVLIPFERSPPHAQKG